jgi:hypothetical protein
MKPVTSRSAGLALLCVLMAGFTSAVLAQAQTSTPGAAETALKRPTDFRTRAEIRNEYQDVEEDGYRNLIVPRFEYAVSPSVAFRVETPYVFHDPGGTDPDRVSGFGDLLVRGAWRAMQSEGFALNLVLEVTFATAVDDRLGSGKDVLAPLVYAAVDLPRQNSVFFPNFQHYVSVAGDSGRPDVNYTVLKPNLLTRWPNNFYTFLEPAFVIDWERDHDFGLTVELEAGKIVSKNVALWVRPGVGAIKHDLPQIYDWNMEIGARYIF